MAQKQKLLFFNVESFFCGVVYYPCIEINNHFTSIRDSRFWWIRVNKLDTTILNEFTIKGLSQILDSTIFSLILFYIIFYSKVSLPVQVS